MWSSKNPLYNARVRGGVCVAVRSGGAIDYSIWR